VKRLIAAAVGLFGLVAYLRRRRQPAAPEVEPADELRARLAQKKDEPPADPEPEPAPDPEQGAPPDTLAVRREDVHDRARAAIDELG
jgi:hypothetical protein